MPVSMNPNTLWFDDVETTNAVATVRPVPNRADRRRIARAGGKPNPGTRKDKRLKSNKKGKKK